MANRAELLKAMKLISDYCDNTGCEDCEIAYECDTFFNSTQPAFWDLEDGESNEG